MIAPINYSAQMVDPFQGLGEFVGIGQQVRQARQQDAKQKQAEQAAEQYRADITAAMSNPSPTAFASLALKYPGQREAFKQGWEAISAEQQQGELRDAGRLAAALSSGRPDVAERLITERITAAKNSGVQAPELEMLLDSIKANPRQAYGQVLHLVSALPGGDKVLESLGKVGAEQRAQEQAPGALRKVNADADAAESGAKTAAVTARFAEPQALKDLELKGWNITAIKEDIGYKKEANRIAAMNAAENKAGNDLKRQELGLKVEEARRALDEKARTKVADVESATGTIDNLINTVDRIKKNPSLNDVVGSIEGRLPALVSDEASDAIALIDTLGSQVFMSQIPAMKGTGALSEKEGDKLQTSLQNLGRAQSEGQFRANLDEVQRLMLKARKNVETRYGIKTAPPDTPAVQSTPEQINDLVNKYLNPRPVGAR